MAEIMTRAQAYEESEDVGRNPTDNPTIGDVIADRLGRRDLLKGALGIAAIAATVSPLALATASRANADNATRFHFDEIEAGVDADHHVAEGYDADVLIRWGDPVPPSAPRSIRATRRRPQKLQFGYNCDSVGYVPMPGAAMRPITGCWSSTTNTPTKNSCFPVSAAGHQVCAFAEMTKDLVDIEMAAHGGAVIEVRRDEASGALSPTRNMHAGFDAIRRWRSAARRPASSRLKTMADPSGRSVIGTLNNCAGGITPWGTWLTCEENFHGYFRGKFPDAHPEARNHRRYGVAGNWYAWGKFHDRFDVLQGAERGQPLRLDRGDRSV